VAWGQVAAIASGNPVSPSQQTMSTSGTPRLASSAHTPAQNLAPSWVCTNPIATRYRRRVDLNTSVCLVRALPVDGGRYPVIHLDAIVVEVRDGGHVRNKAAHLAVGVDMDGVKHVLGIWV
jgi:hypothetical protein